MPLEMKYEVMDEVPKITSKGGGGGRSKGAIYQLVREIKDRDPKRVVCVGTAEKSGTVQSVAQSLRKEFGLDARLTGFSASTRKLENGGYGVYVKWDESLIEPGFEYVPRKRGRPAKNGNGATPAEAASEVKDNMEGSANTPEATEASKTEKASKANKKAG